MGTMTIDGRKVEFTDEKNVLTVIRNAGINIPTLCYHSELSTFGACRLCTVEDDRGRTFASCSEQPRDGMVIYTNSGRIKKYRKLIVTSVLKIRESSMRSMKAHRPLSVIRINVSSAVTVYVPVRNFRESELLVLRSVELRLWSCLHLTRRSQKHSV